MLSRCIDLSEVKILIKAFLQTVFAFVVLRNHRTEQVSKVWNKGRGGKTQADSSAGCKRESQMFSADFYILKCVKCDGNTGDAEEKQTNQRRVNAKHRLDKDKSEKW